MKSREFQKEERTLRLADLLLEDIANRKLTEGANYFTTVEAASFLGVSGASANRALQLLEQRGILERGRRRGAILLKNTFSEPLVKHVYFLINSRFSSSHTEQYCEKIVSGIRCEMPVSHIYPIILTPKSENIRIKQLLNEAHGSGQKVGFIMHSSSPQIQTMLGRSGYPCVSLGSRFFGTKEFSSYDIDRNLMLRTLYDYLHERGRRKITLVLRRLMMPGDIDTVNIAMRLGIPNCYFIMNKDGDPEIIDELTELIAKKYDPDGFICLIPQYAEAVVEALKRLGRNPDLSDITVMYYYLVGAMPKFSHTRSTVTPHELGRNVARMLNEAALGVPPRCEYAPIELIRREDYQDTQVHKARKKKKVVEDPKTVKSGYQISWAFFH